MTKNKQKNSMLNNSETSELERTKLPSSGDELGSFPKRLQKVIGGQSVRSFAAACKLSDGVVRQYLSGKSEPGLSALLNIARTTGVLVGWLAAGEGPMRRGEVAYPSIDGLGGTESVNYAPMPFAELSEISQRFLRLPSLLDLTDAEFCRIIDLDPVELNKIRAGRPVSGLLTRAVAHEWGVRMRWLNMGEMPFKNPSGGVDQFARDMLGLIAQEHLDRKAGEGRS